MPCFPADVAGAALPSPFPYHTFFVFSYWTMRKSMSSVSPPLWLFDLSGVDNVRRPLPRIAMYFGRGSTSLLCSSTVVVHGDTPTACSSLLSRRWQATLHYTSLNDGAVVPVGMLCCAVFLPLSPHPLLFLLFLLMLLLLLLLLLPGT